MRYKVTVQYNGAGYAGWQKQPGLATIQQAIETALEKIHQRPVSIQGSGRTDAKVHALGQVFHFDSDLNIDVESWRRALNANVSKGIRIVQVESAQDDFHARYDATQKHYRYWLEMGAFNVFQEDTVFQLNQALDIPLMQQASRIFVGTHDFTSFCANSLDELPDQVRTIYGLEILSDGQKVQIDVFGNGFMRYMVRMIVGALVKVGLGKLSVNELRGILLAKDKQAGSFNIDGCGLYLVDVIYDKENNA